MGKTRRKLGEIRATQKFLKRPGTPIMQLARKSQKRLTAMLQELEAELTTAKQV